MTRDEMRDKAIQAADFALFFGGRRSGRVDKVVDAVFTAIESTGHVIVPREPDQERIGAATTRGMDSLTAMFAYDLMATNYGQEGSRAGHYLSDRAYEGTRPATEKDSGS